MSIYGSFGEDKTLPHRINRHSKAFPVKIGSVDLGEIPRTELENGLAQPNPIKISWSRTNIVKVHEIPYPIHKTVRTSKKTLYKMTMQLKTLKTEIFDKLLAACDMCGPHYIQTGTSPSPLWMYIIDYSFDQNAGYDDDYIEWNLSFQEVYD